MPVTIGNPAPYAPASAVLEVVDRYRARGLPSPIGAEVLGRAGIAESLIPRTIQALRTLDLIDDDGKPTATFEGLRLAPEGEYKERLSQWLNNAYADVLTYVDPATADETALRDAFRSYSPVGQQPRMVSLFTALYAAAGSGPGKATSTRGSKRARVPMNHNSSGNTNPVRRGKAPPASTSLPTTDRQETLCGEFSPVTDTPMSDKALEYELVDLLKNDDIDEGQREAIWILVQYLAVRSKNIMTDCKKMLSFDHKTSSR